MSTVYVGLGPRGDSVAAERLSDAFEAYGGVLRVTHRGRFALVEMNDARTATAVINALDNTQVDGVTLRLRADAREAEGTSAGFSDRRRIEPTGTSLFVGLGPNGHEVTQDALVKHLAPFGAVSSVVLRGSFAIVEAASVVDAARLCREASGTMLLSCRLSVREDQGGSRGGSFAGGRGSGGSRGGSFAGGRGFGGSRGGSFENGRGFGGSRGGRRY
jgi:hypothetical protein